MFGTKEKTKDSKLTFTGITLRWRLFLAFVATSLLPSLLLLVILSNTLFVGVQHLEETHVRDTLNRALYALNQQGKQISANVEDYAHWDEMYEQAARTRDADWFRINITEWIPAQFNIDVILLADADGQVFYEYQTPDDLSDNVANFPLFQSAKRGQETFGIYATADRLLLTASAFVTPALRSETTYAPEESPAVLIYGRYIDSEVASSIKDTVGADIHFFDRKTMIGTSEDDHQKLIGVPWEQTAPFIRNALSIAGSTQQQTAEQIAIITPLHDLYDVSIGALSVTVNRSTENLVRGQILKSMYVSFIGSVIAAMVLSLLFGWQLSRSIRQLSADMVGYATGSLHSASHTERGDEIGMLQNNFANMVESIEYARQRETKRQNELQTNNERLRNNSAALDRMRKDLENRVKELKELNEILVGRELRMAELKQENKRLKLQLDAKPAKPKRKKSKA